jgi:hypothetical protein
MVRETPRFQQDLSDSALDPQIIKDETLNILLAGRDTVRPSLSPVM